MKDKEGEGGCERGIEIEGEGEKARKMAGGMSSHLVSTQLALLNHLIRLELCREPGLSFPVARLHYQQLKVLVLSSFTMCVFDTLVDMYFETCVARSGYVTL